MCTRWTACRQPFRRTDCSNLEECQHCASAVNDEMSLGVKNFKFLLSAERSVQDDQYSGIRWQFWCRDLVEALSWCHAVWNLPPVATMMRRRNKKFTKTMERRKNIAKGTTDPRVEFITQVLTQIFNFKSWPNLLLKIWTKATKSATNCCQHDPHHQHQQQQ